MSAAGTSAPGCLDHRWYCSVHGPRVLAANPDTDKPVFFPGPLDPKIFAGAWGTGPFDNLDAQHWCEIFSDAQPAERKRQVREALEYAAQSPYMTSTFAQEAIAAAAVVVASSRGQALTATFPNGSLHATAEGTYAPGAENTYTRTLLTEDANLDLADGIAPLAAQAMDNVLGAHSDWWQIWHTNAGADEAKATVQGLRAALTTNPRRP